VSNVGCDLVVQAYESVEDFVFAHDLMNYHAGLVARELLDPLGHQCRGIRAGYARRWRCIGRQNHIGIWVYGTDHSSMAVHQEPSCHVSS
jgi:hypothetical protein